MSDRSFKNRSSIRAFSRHIRRGSGIVYITLALPVVFLTASLAVDFGRVESGKSRLQTVVDAATRAAAQQLVNQQSTAAARSAAIAVASANTVCGKQVQVSDSDVTFGWWDSTQKTFTANTQQTNAVRVTTSLTPTRNNAIPTYFASFAGKSLQTINASAIACVSSEISPFNATGNVTFNHTGTQTGGQWTTDSYIGNLNSYSSGSARGMGHLLSQGNVQYNFTTPVNANSGWSSRISNIVMGTIYTANGNDVTKTWSMKATGWGTYSIEYGGWDNVGSTTSKLTETVNFGLPSMPSNNTNPAGSSNYISGSNSNGLGDFSITDGRTVTLPGGTYTLNSLTLTNGSQLRFSGPVKLYVDNNITIDSASIVPQKNEAKYLSINVCSSGGQVKLLNMSNDLYADLNCPGSDLTFTQGNGGKSLMGRIKAKNLTFNCTGSGGVHGDESLIRRFSLVQ